MSRVLATLFLAVASAGLTACRACKNEHPFVPYHIEDETPALSGSAVADASRAARADSGDGREPAEVAPAGLTEWTLGHTKLTAPAGATFRQGLSWDVDGDGHEDQMVLTQVVDERVREELYFYRGGAAGEAAPPALLRLGAPLALDARCSRVEHLVRVGRHSVAVELGESCPSEVAEHVPASEPDRVVALLAWSSSFWQRRVMLPVIDPPASPSLAFDLDGSDVDGDGLDDATVRITLEGGGLPFEPSPPVHAVFRWLDRSAGMSREPGEPAASFDGVASIALARALKSKEAVSAVSLATAGRFLFQAVCAESPARRVAPSPASSPLTCEAGLALEKLGLANERAHVTQGDALGAIAALDGASAPPAAHTLRRTDATGWLASIAPTVQATEVRALRAVPRPSPASSWGPLQFEPSGQLLVSAFGGVIRVDPWTGDEAAAAGVTPWDARVVSPDGKLRLDGAFAPCPSEHGVALEVSLGGVGNDAAVDGGVPPIAVPVVAPIDVACASTAPGAREAVPAIPVAWGPGGLELVVLGDPVLVQPAGRKASPLREFLAQPVTPGSPRSPDGATVVVPTSQGILVRGKKTRLLRAKELEHGYGELRSCTVSDDASRVACIRGGLAFVGVWPAP